MSNKPKIQGAKPLLTLKANNEYASLEVSKQPVKAMDLLFEILCAGMTQATVVVMMAVERIRQTRPEIYQQYIDHINRALMCGAAGQPSN